MKRPPRRAAVRLHQISTALAVAVAVLTGASCAPGPAADPTAPEASTPLTEGSPSVDELPRPVESGTRYVALGSSMASGPGLAPIVDEPCQRSGVNYPHRVAAELDVGLTDVTCAGATTDNVLATPQESAGVDAPQLDAVTPETELVTVTIGGNDIQYGSILDRFGYGCVGAEGCPPVPEDLPLFDADLRTVTSRVAAMLQAISNRAPAARVLVVTYPRIVAPGGGGCEVAPFTPEVAEYLRAIGDRLDRALRDAAERAGAQVVDVYSASSDLGACEPDQPWVTGLPAGSAPAGTLSFHATGAGMSAVAELVVQASGG